MTNPVIHVLILIAAVVVPGGLLVYFAWLARKRKKKDGPPIELTAVEEAREAFMKMYPKRSLRGESRKKRLGRAKAFRRRKAQISQD